jgi:hypothetical protein
MRWLERDDGIDLWRCDGCGQPVQYRRLWRRQTIVDRYLAEPDGRPHICSQDMPVIAPQSKSDGERPKVVSDTAGRQKGRSRAARAWEVRL